MTRPRFRITFHGAAGTVTGSRYLVEIGSRTVLVDCGLFQGYKQLRLRNWAPLPFSARNLDAVVLTHAHIDHSGYLPVLVRAGYQGPIHCSTPTRDLCGILLPDSGHLQAADAEFARRHGFSKHHPPKPLYDEAEAREVLPLLQAMPPGVVTDLGDGVSVELRPVGHILGACSVVLRAHGRTVCFSGDVGRPDDPLMLPPEARPTSDVLVIESTYGDRLHDRTDPEEALAAVVRRTIGRGGTLVVPSFAVGRAQLLLLLLSRLRRRGAIPDVPIYLDSPMATSATSLYREHADWHRLDEEGCRRAFDSARYVQSPEDSKAVDAAGSDPAIVVSASGMATGGRVVHHLKRFAPFEKNTILFAGYQAGGTRGASMVAGAESVKIHGDWVPVRAEIHSLGMLSAHADRDELTAWARSNDARPHHVYVTHGEPTAADSFRHHLQEELGWDAHVPEQGERVDL